MSAKPKNLNELRELVLEQIQKVLDNKIDSETVNSFCHLCNTALGTLKVEIDYIKATGAQPQISFVNSSIKEIPYKK